MSTSQNEDPVSMEPISNETGLVRRSEFLTNRVKRLARQVRAVLVEFGAEQEVKTECEKISLPVYVS